MVDLGNEAIMRHEHQANMTTSVGTTPLEQLQPVWTLCDELDIRLGQLADGRSSLTERLGPICGPIPSSLKGADRAVLPGASPLAERLGNMIRRVEEETLALYELRGALEV